MSSCVLVLCAQSLSNREGRRGQECSANCTEAMGQHKFPRAVKIRLAEWLWEAEVQNAIQNS